MFGNAARNRVKQSAIVVSDTAFTLTGGAADSGFRTFYAAFVGALTAPSGSYAWQDVPVLVTQGSAWQLMTATFTGDTSGSTATLTSGVVHETSTGASLSLVVGSSVTVEIVPTAKQYGYLAMGQAPYTAYSVANPDNPGSGDFTNPLIIGDGVMAAGAIARAGGAHCFAIGYRASAYAAHSVALGTRGGSYQPGAIGFANSWHGEVFSNAYDFFVSPEVVSLSALTTDATPTNLGFYNDKVLVTDGDLLYCDAGISVFECTVVAMNATDSKVWNYTVCVRTTSDYVTSAIVGTPVKTELYESAGATAWDINLVQDTDQNFNLRGTGAAATNVSWSATVRIIHHYFADA